VIVTYQVNAKSVEWNPSPGRLRELTEKMPNSQVTEFGNVVVKTRVDSRSKASTYIVTDDPDSVTDQTITRAEYERIAALQDAYIADGDMLVVDGYIGSDPGFRTRARLVIEAANANIGGMQQQLYYPLEERGAGHHCCLHAQPGCGGLPQRPDHRGGPGVEHHARPQLGLLR
jgi:phosphoenolpyruvate carboxykinase (ATP)